MKFTDDDSIAKKIFYVCNKIIENTDKVLVIQMDGVPYIENDVLHQLSKNFEIFFQLKKKKIYISSANPRCYNWIKTIKKSQNIFLFNNIESILKIVDKKIRSSELTTYIDRKKNENAPVQKYNSTDLITKVSSNKSELNNNIISPLSDSAITQIQKQIEKTRDIFIDFPANIDLRLAPEDYSSILKKMSDLLDIEDKAKIICSFKNTEFVDVQFWTDFIRWFNLISFKTSEITIITHNTNILRNLKKYQLESKVKIQSFI